MKRFPAPLTLLKWPLFYAKIQQLTYKMMQHWMKSSNSIVPLPYRSNLRIKILIKLSDSRYPNAVNAVRNSFLSILPEPSESKERKQFCQSVTYFHNAPKSWKLTVPRFSLSNIPRIYFSLLDKVEIKKKLNEIPLGLRYSTSKNSLDREQNVICLRQNKKLFSHKHCMNHRVAERGKIRKFLFIVQTKWPTIIYGVWWSVI